MRASFNNRLKIQENKTQAPRIHYKNTRRVALNIFIDHMSEKNSPRDWHITLEGESAIVSHMRQIVVSEILAYLKQRADQKFATISFMDILSLADMRSVH
jgi:hypothetical protein